MVNPQSSVHSEHLIRIESKLDGFIRDAQQWQLDTTGRIGKIEAAVEWRLTRLETISTHMGTLESTIEGRLARLETKAGIWGGLAGGLLGFVSGLLSRFLIDAWR